MSTDESRAVASERTVVKAPFGDENTGVLIAAGDPLPAGAAGGLIQNTPNKVDAAANYDDVDAADKATGGRPATTVVTRTSPERQAELEEIAARVEGNRNAWEQESQMLGNAAASPDTTSTDDAPTDPSEMTGKQLDAAYGDVDGYPKTAKVAERQAFAVEYEQSRT